VTPAALFLAQAEQKYLSAREAVAEAVFRSAYEQRLQIDDRAMGMLQKLSRRIDALTEDDDTLPIRWKFLKDFLVSVAAGSGDVTACASSWRRTSG